MEAFNAESSYNIMIKINEHTLFHQTFHSTKIQKLKIYEYVDYVESNVNKVNIIWSGDKECENKHLKIYKLVINDQHIAPHSVISYPVENDYIKTLKSTKEGQLEYRKKILYPGHEHGWYGTYQFRFGIDSSPTSADALGIRDNVIYSNMERGTHSKRANKK